MVNQLYSLKLGIMSNSGIARPESRYGTDDPAKPKGIAGKIIAALLVLIIIAAVFAIARYVQQRNHIPVQASVAAYERQDDQTMRLWVDITRDDVSKDSYCIVTALNYDMAEVGRREVLVPAGGDSGLRVEVDIPTRDYPVSTGIYGCATDIPSYMDIDNPVNTF